MDRIDNFRALTRDLTRSGVLGDATVASREKGDRLLAALARGWQQVIVDIYRFQQPQAWQT